jgi:hypothetical protein
VVGQNDTVDLRFVVAAMQLGVNIASSELGAYVAVGSLSVVDFLDSEVPEGTYLVRPVVTESSDVQASPSEPLFAANWTHYRGRVPGSLDDDGVDHRFSLHLGAMQLLLHQGTIASFSQSVTTHFLVPILDIIRPTASTAVPVQPPVNTLEAAAEPSSSRAAVVVSALHFGVALEADFGTLTLLVRAAGSSLAECKLEGARVSLNLSRVGSLDASAVVSKGFTLTDLRGPLRSLVASVHTADDELDPALLASVKLRASDLLSLSGSASAEELPPVSLDVCIRRMRVVLVLSFITDVLWYINEFKTMLLNMACTLGLVGAAGSKMVRLDQEAPTTEALAVEVAEESLALNKLSLHVRLVHPCLIIPTASARGEPQAAVAQPDELVITARASSLALELMNTKFLLGRSASLASSHDVQLSDAALVDVFDDHFDLSIAVHPRQVDPTNYEVLLRIPAVGMQLTSVQMQVVLSTFDQLLRQVDGLMAAVRDLSSFEVGGVLPNAPPTPVPSRTPALPADVKDRGRGSTIHFGAEVAHFNLRLLIGAADSRKLAAIDVRGFAFAGEVDTAGTMQFSLDVRRGALRDIRDGSRRQRMDDRIVSVGVPSDDAPSALALRVKLEGPQLMVSLRADDVEVVFIPESVAAFAAALVTFVRSIDIVSEGESKITVLHSEFSSQRFAVAVPAWPSQVVLAERDPLMGYRVSWPLLSLTCVVRSTAESRQLLFTTESEMQLQRYLFPGSGPVDQGFDLKRAVIDRFRAVINLTHSAQFHGQSSLMLAVAIPRLDIGLNVRELEPVISVSDDWISAVNTVLDALNAESVDSTRSVPKLPPPSEKGAGSENDAASTSDPVTTAAEDLAGSPGMSVAVHLTSEEFQLTVNAYRGAPLMTFRAAQVQGEASVLPAGKKIEALLDVNFSAQYYNVPLDSYESLVEEFPLSLKFDYVPDEDPSFVMTSTEHLAINVSSEFVRALSLAFSPSTAMLSMKVPRVHGYFVSDNTDRILIRNYTGVNFFYMLQCTTASASSESDGAVAKPGSAADRVREVAAGSEEDLHEAGTEAVVDRISALKNYSLSMWPNGPLSPVHGVGVDGYVGLREISMLQTEQSVNVGMVLNAFSEASARVLEFRSPIEIRNRLHESITPYFMSPPNDNQSSADVTSAAPIPPRGRLFVPLHQLHSRLLLRPTEHERRWDFSKFLASVGSASSAGPPPGGSGGVSSPAGKFGTGLWLNRLHCSGMLLCCRFVKSGAVAPPFVVLVSIDNDKDLKAEYVPPSNVALHVISLRAPLRLVNLLPVRIEYRLEYILRGLHGVDKLPPAEQQKLHYNRMTSGEIATGESADITVLNPGRGCSHVRVCVPGFEWSSPALVDLAVQGESKLTVVLPEAGGMRGGSTLELTIGIKVDAYNRVIMTYYCSYWIINRTQLPMSFRQTGSSELAVGQAASTELFRRFEQASSVDKATDPRLWYNMMDSEVAAALERPLLYSHVRGKGNICARVASSAWSEGLLVSSNNSTLSLELPDKSGSGVLYELGMTLAPAPAPFWKTKTLTFAPYRVLVNRTGRTLLYRQYTQDHHGFVLEPGESMPFYWPDLNVRKMVELRLQCGAEFTAWSPAVAIDVGVLHVLNLRHGAATMELLRVETKLEDASLYVVLALESAEHPAFEVRNMTERAFLVRQKGSSYDEQCVRANSRLALGLDAPVQEPLFLLRDVETGAVVEFNLSQEGTPAPLQCGTSARVHLNVLTVGPTKQLVLSDSDHIRFASYMRRTLLRCLVSFPRVGLSLIDNRRTKKCPQPREIFYVSVTGTELHVIWMASNIKAALSVGDFQVDNQLIDASTEVAFVTVREDGLEGAAPGAAAAAAAAVAQPDSGPAIQVSMMVTEQSARLVHLEYFSFALAKMDVRLDGVTASVFLDMLSFFEAQSDTLVASLQQYVANLRDLQQSTARRAVDAAAAGEAAESAAESRSRLRQNLFAVPESALSDSFLVSYRALRVDPVVFFLTFEYRAGSDFLELRQFENFAGGLLNFDHANIHASGLSLRQQHVTVAELVRVFRVHYSRQVQLQLATMFGHWDAIGSPLGLVSNVSTGVLDFFSEPLKQRSLSQGLAKGTSSLVENSVGGLFGSGSKVTGSISTGLASLSMDADYLKQRQTMRRTKPRDFSEGVSQGVRDLSIGVFTGVTGIFTQPVIGAAQEGVSGLAKGVGKGVLGLGAKPLAGVMDLMSSTMGGLKSTTEFTKERQRVRQPRFFRPDGLLGPYHASSAFGWSLLYRLSDPELSQLIYVSHHRLFSTRSGKGWLLIASTHALLLEYATDKSPTWVFSWTHFRTMEMDKNAIVFHLGHAGPGSAARRTAYCETPEIAQRLYDDVSASSVLGFRRVAK